jgi:hypothetical protein
MNCILQSFLEEYSYSALKKLMVTSMTQLPMTYKNQSTQIQTGKFTIEQIGRPCAKFTMYNFYIFREKPGEPEWNNLEDMKIPFLLNYAQCKLFLHDYYPVIEHTSTVLKRDPGMSITQMGPMYVSNSNETQVCQ